MLQDKLSSTEQQLTAAQQELQTTQSDKQHLSSKLKSVRQQLTKANRAAADAGKQHQEYKVGGGGDAEITVLHLLAYTQNR